MNLKSTLAEMAQLLASDDDDFPIDAGEMLREIIGGELDAAPIILDLLAGEGARKRRRDNVIGALIQMLGIAAEQLRFHLDEQRADALAAFEKVKAIIGEATNAGRIDAGAMVLIGRAFWRANLDLGPTLRGAMAAQADASPPPGPRAPANGAGGAKAEIEEVLREIVAQSGGDPFAIYAFASEMTNALPDAARVRFVSALAQSRSAPIRDASVGFLLDADAEVCASAAYGLSAVGANAVSQQSLNRMVLMRNWLDQPRRDTLDGALRAARSGAPAVKSSALQQTRFMSMSTVDGAGALSVYVGFKEKTGVGLASVLIKDGFGVRDAFVLRNRKKREMDEMLAGMDPQLEFFPTTRESIIMLIGHALATNLAIAAPPPFGLAQVVEMAGLGIIAPEHISTARLVADLISAIPDAEAGNAAIARALQHSSYWPEISGIPDSWFEDNDSVDTLLTGKPRRQHTTLLLEQLLPQRRVIWADKMAWSALALRQEQDNALGREMALVARELLGERDLKSIPIMRWIADATADAYAARRSARGRRSGRA